MPLTSSTFENGSYSDGKWLCACDNPVQWRVVSKEGETKGQRFLRCNSQPQCSFFLWEVHEKNARKKLNERSSQPPTTPTSTTTQANALYLPTPSTAAWDSTLPTRTRGLPISNGTPTRSRGKAASLSSIKTDGENDEDDEDGNNSTLLPQIITRLRSDGVLLKPSTREYLGHLLREQSAIDVAKLQTRNDTIARLCKELDRLTVKANVDVP
ncbi:hypothetical protein N657DRAFT_643570 [Parathielavia appendiculata]|uniref:GRF-type domain-containing protein n=1 Tax=Parathielavia appendiculata TaxID=2587402 RepID=A0AAN6U1Q3_9PEZI|nr:hypothetical protein N657DRAFT_643570 [Parathielavia appendiculata]